MRGVTRPWVLGRPSSHLAKTKSATTRTSTQRTAGATTARRLLSLSRSAGFGTSAVSAVAPRKIGFGFLLDDETLKRINDHRADLDYPVTSSGVDIGSAWIKVQEQAGVFAPTRKMPPLPLNIPADFWGNEKGACAVGLWHMAPGSGKEGWWLGVHIIVHTYNVLMAFDFVYGQHSGLETPHQAVCYFDHSAQHGHHKPDALCTTKMASSYGGQQTIVRDTEIVRARGFLGPLEAKYPDGTDAKLRAGDVQKGYFDDPTRPPFYDLYAPPGDGRVVTYPEAPKGANEYQRALNVLVSNTAAEAEIAAKTSGTGVVVGPGPHKGEKCSIQRQLSGALDSNRCVSVRKWYRFERAQQKSSSGTSF